MQETFCPNQRKLGGEIWSLDQKLKIELIRQKLLRQEVSIEEANSLLRKHKVSQIIFLQSDRGPILVR